MGLHLRMPNPGIVKVHPNSSLPLNQTTGILPTHPLIHGGLAIQRYLARHNSPQQEHDNM